MVRLFIGGVSTSTGYIPTSKGELLGILLINTFFFPSVEKVHLRVHSIDHGLTSHTTEGSSEVSPSPSRNHRPGPNR